MGTQVAGLASGMDWKSTVSQLIELEKRPLYTMQSEQSKNTKKVSALSEIKTKLSNLQDKGDLLKKSTSDYYDRTVSYIKTSDEQNFTAKADGSTPLGTYGINIIRKATATKVDGAALSTTAGEASDTLASLNVSTAISAGKFSINGAEITIATSDTLSDVFTKISDATGGAVTGALVADKIELTAHEINGVTSRITVGASSDDSNFLEVMKLYTDTSTTPPATISSSSTLGTLTVNTNLSNVIDTSTLTNLTGTKGTMVINGKTITFDTVSSSIRSIMNDINASGANVLTNFDPGSGKFSIVNQETGSLGVSMTDTSGMLAKLGLTSTAGATTTYGVNAQFSVNGSSTVINSTSNILTEEQHGIPGLEVEIKRTGEDTITVAADTAKAKTNIQAFLDAYNSVVSTINNYTKITIGADEKVTTSLLSENREIQSWVTSLRSMLFQKVETGTDTVSRLFHLGIDYNENEMLEITDNEVFADALKDTPEAVSKIFNNSGDGLGVKIYDFIKNIEKTDGSYETQVNTLNKANNSLDTQIAALEDRIEANRERMTMSYVKMEEMQSKISQNLQALQSFGLA